MQAVLAGLQDYRVAAAAAAATAAAAPLAAHDASGDGSSTNSSSRHCDGVIVKFLLSIDRRNDTAAALDTVSPGCGGGLIYLPQGALCAAQPAQARCV
jgi:hypothetical protein